MSTRWWAPEGAHIGPDERDFELLIPVDDARHDLGAALLALHRVGAAACEEVALHAIPDEVSLVSALASARTAFAAPLVESVSKSVGEGPYAGLLVRDVIDDAEKAALTTFRTLVSKGVPASLAVQRVGLVYGVPESDLGRYLSVAGELRVHPAALNDAADRALFSAIEKIATEELEAKPAPWEPVAKTRPGDEVVTRNREVITRDKEVITRDDPATPYYDARDRQGRFARGSVIGPPAVGAPVERKERVGRVERVNRVERVERVQPGMAERTLQAKPKERVLGRDVARLKRSRQEMTETEKNRLISLDPVTWSDGDYLDPIKHPSTQGPFQQIEHELAIGMSTEEWAELQAHLGRDEQGRLAFRMGHISQERDANDFGRASDYETDEHRKVLNRLAADALSAFEDEHAGRDIELPITVTIDDDEINNLDPEHLQDFINGRKFDVLAAWLQEKGADPYTPENQRFIMDAIQMMRSTRSPDNRGDVYHYIPRVSGNAVAPRISVVELVFEPGVLGRDEGHGKHTDYVFDPNQVMRVENGRPAVIYDPKIRAFRLRYFITPDVSKADYLDEHNVANGPGGRFVREGARKEVIQRDREVIRRDESVTRSTPRVERVARAGRVERINPQIIPRSLSRKPVERQLSRAEHNQQVQRKLIEIEQSKNASGRRGYREFFAHGNYRVFSREAMDEIEQRAEMQPGDDGIYVFNNDDKEQLLLNKMDGRLADFTMREMTDRDIMGMDDEQGIAGAYKTLPNPATPLDPTSDDFVFRVHDHMDSLFAKNPDIEQIQVFYDLDGSVSFLGNKYSADPVVLVEVAHGFDPDKPFRMEFDSSIRHDDLVPDFDDPIESMREMMSSLHYDADDAVNDKTLPLKLTRPKIDIYRLENLSGETDDEV